MNHSHGCGQEVSAAQDCLSVLTAWQWASSRSSGHREQDGSHIVFYDLGSEITIPHFHDVPLVAQAGSPQGEWGPHRCRSTKRQVGIIWACFLLCQMWLLALPGSPLRVAGSPE